MTGQQLFVKVSDPWDFCTEHGTGPFSAVVENASGDELVLRFPSTLAYKGVVFDRVVATARHVDKPLHLISTRDEVPANLTPVPSLTGPDEDDAFGRAAGWRAWHLIATVSAA